MLLKVRISRQMYKHFSPLLQVCRLFGILPVTLEKNKVELFLKWSPLYASYSCLFGLFIVGAAFYAVFGDNFATQLSTSDTVKNIDKWVSLLPVGGFCAATLCSIFIAGRRFSQLFEYIDCINQVDSMIKTNPMKSRKPLWAAFCLFVNCEAVHVLTIYSYYKIAGDIAEALKKLMKKHQAYIVNIYVSILMECLIQHMIYNLTIRFTRLSEVLHEHYRQLLKENERTSLGTFSKDFKNFQRYSNTPVRKLPSITLLSNTNNSNNKDITCLNLSKAYLKLVNSARILDDLFGFIILVSTGNACFNLVHTSYYAILVLEGRRGNLFELTMRLLVFSFETLRILFITEPFYECRLKMEATGKHVCNLLSLNIDRCYRKQVDAFAKSICLSRMKFSAWGLFDVDRLLVTTVIGAVTTYVVILLQAKHQDDAR